MLGYERTHQSCRVTTQAVISPRLHRAVPQAVPATLRWAPPWPSVAGVQTGLPLWLPKGWENVELTLLCHTLPATIV